jgi:hypothetical protein
MWIPMTIYFKTHILAITLEKISHQRTMIKYINVIVSSKQTKEGMPYLQALVCNNFQYYEDFALSILKSSLSMKEDSPSTHSAYKPMMMQTY